MRVFALDGSLLGGCLWDVNWYWVFPYLYCDGNHWTLFIGASDIIGLRRPGTKISVKFRIIQLDTIFLAYDLLIMSMFDRIETYY